MEQNESMKDFATLFTSAFSVCPEQHKKGLKAAYNLVCTYPEEQHGNWPGDTWAGSEFNGVEYDTQFDMEEDVEGEYIPTITMYLYTGGNLGPCIFKWNSVNGMLHCDDST